MYTVAVDIGGTFTDVVVIDSKARRTLVGKVLTTPDDLKVGVLRGLAEAAAEGGLELTEVLKRAGRFVHATTTSSNAILAYAGAKSAVLTTRGFGDTLLIMRATGRVAGLSVFARHNYSRTDKPRPVADERAIFEITERVDRDGRVVVPLDEAEVRAAAKRIAVQGYQAVAVAFLFSHLNPAHERRARDILKDELPGAFISLSSEVAPVLGEYERSATALFNAYVGPVMIGYLEGLEAELKRAGLKKKLLLVQSNGGIATARQTIPIMTVESGPAAGVVGAAHLARELGYPNVIATDVGGTTFKVGLIERGSWGYAKETVINQYQLRLPTVDVASIGSGGGSIAWIDGSRLRVGPQSSGAQPGPAAYGQGGEEPTVTDADVVLGYISPDRFLGGRMTLVPERAEAAIRERIARPMFGGDVIAAAAGIRQVIDGQMADLIRKSTLERGFDPREFVMMAYGGSGPTHAATYGVDAGLGEIIVPFHATVHSAVGAALLDARFSIRTSEPAVLPVPPARLEKLFVGLEAEGTRLLAQAEIKPGSRRFERWVEARYRRQVHNLRIAVARRFDAAAVKKLARDFEAEYERRFGPGSALKEAGIELIHYGVEAIGRVDKPAVVASAVDGTTGRPRARRPTYCPRRRTMVETPIYDGPRLPRGSRIKGPAVIEHPGTTIVVFAGQTATIDRHRHTHIRTSGP